MAEPIIDEALREVSPLPFLLLNFTFRPAEIFQRLKSALWFSIGKIVDEEILQLNVNATPQFIGALTEMVWAQIENVSRDLESFARHAGRSTVSTDDVLLLARRNEGLGELLKAFVDEENAGKLADKGRGKGKGVAKK
ncbi:kinetochore component CENP-S-domain-containing protein [Tuber indicum]|nr:kinetochore component CENP-S-domain-containing protein [Tuber indicum]